jgi:rfaE bifunctional protein nucleotidyltransferase chain/domain
MKIVLTCGVYDVLHIGHINILRRAKCLGDHLVVGIQTDAWVMKTKSKPILSTKERMEQMKALGIADKVISYTGSNSILKPFLNTLKKVKPNIFVHGEDWVKQHDTLEIKEYMKKHGIKIVLLPRTKGISSTDIKERITQKCGDSRSKL